MFNSEISFIVFIRSNVSEILILSPNIAFRDRLWYTVVAEADFRNRR